MQEPLSPARRADSTEEVRGMATLPASLLAAAACSQLDFMPADYSKRAKLDPRREERRRELQDAALSRANPLAACIGVVNADLQFLAGELLGLAMFCRPAATYDTYALNDAMGMLMGVYRQIERFAVLDSRFDEPRPETPAPAPSE